jgi:uncharacterized membrane protein
MSVMLRRPQTQKQKRRARKRSGVNSCQHGELFGPHIEPLEERRMLDGGLGSSNPPAIVVGRTLSAYDVADIQNNQLTITYTVYNEQADPVSGLLLVDTLQPGVTVASASGAPNQNGPQLSWDLGTVNGFGRASVQLTVALTNPGPGPLDGGAGAFGTLDGITVSASTPSAALGAGMVAAGLLASTPDANTADPYVQEKAAELGYDPVRIFDFVRDRVAYESYAGSLRGARGTLWSAAGNSLDKASLLVALLRASGIPARYDQGTLSQDLARQLIQSMFPQPLSVVGCLDPGTLLADPVNDPQLLAESRDHYWVEFDAGHGFQAADPDFAGAQVGQTFTTAQASFNEVPAGLRHTAEIRLTAELSSSASALFGGGAINLTALDSTFNTVDLVGVPLTLGSLVTQTTLNALVFSSKTINYSPYVRIGRHPENPLTDPVVRGTDFQEVQTNFPFGSQALTGLFLDVTLNDPQAGGPVQAQTLRKDLVDKIGFANRQSGGGVTIGTSPGGLPSVTDFDLTTLLISASLQPTSTLAVRGQAINQMSQQLNAQRAGLNQTDPALQKQAFQKANDTSKDLLDETTASLGEAFLANADSLMAAGERGFLVHAYHDSPRVVAVSGSLVDFDPATGNGQIKVVIDLMKDVPRVEAMPAQAAVAAQVFQAVHGIDDSVIEGQLLERFASNGSHVRASSAVAVFDAAIGAGIAVAGIDRQNLATLASLPLSADAKARITQSVLAGKAVIVPVAMVAVDGVSTISWIESDPTSGATIYVAEDGTHQGLIEFSLRDGTNPEEQYLEGFLAGFIAVQEFALLSRAFQAELILDPVALKEAVRVEVQLFAASLRLFPPTTFFGRGFQDGAAAAAEVIQTVDPPVGSILFDMPPSPAFANLGAGQTAGIATAVISDPAFTVPVGGAQVPTVFRVGIKNAGPTTATFSITPANLPAGFEAMTSVRQITIPAGQTAEVGICLTPTGGVPAPGTTASFDVTVTSTTDPAVTATTLVSFTVPAIDGVTLAASPASVGLAPSGSATTALTLTNVGNVPETVTLTSSASAGLTVTGLGTVSLQPGQSATEMVTLTLDASTPLNSTLTATITATFGPPTAPLTQAVVIPVQVVVPGARAIAAAAAAAEQLGDAALANRLRDLGIALTSLVQDPANPVFKGQALAGLDSILAQLAADPILSGFVDDLAAGRNQLAAATSVAETQAAVDRLGAALDAFGGTVTDLSRHNFEVFLLPNTQVAQPQTPAPFDLRLHNIGTETTTYTVSLSGLPPGVMGGLSEATVTLDHDESSDVSVTITQPDGAELRAFDFRVTVSVVGASEISKTATGAFSARREFLSVVDVTSRPPFTEPGGRVDISARLLNAVNRQQDVLVSYTVSTLGGQQVFSSNPVPARLTVQSSLVTVDLGTLNTTGFVPGSDTIEVTVTDPDGRPIPGGSGRGTLLVGSPVGASLSVTPELLPPGTSTVGNTLVIDGRASLGGSFRVVSQASAPGALDALRAGNLVYVGGPNGIVVFDATDVTNPQLLRTVGLPADRLRVRGDRLVALRGGTSLVVSVYSLADPQTPQLLGSTPEIPYNFAQDLIVTDTHAFVALGQIGFFLFNRDVFAQNGDLLSIDITDPTAPHLDDVLINTFGTNNDNNPPGDPSGFHNNGGAFFVWSVVQADPQTLLITSSTSTGTDTQVGVGRVRVVDISDPAHMSIVRDLEIPGTVQAFGIAIDGTRALVTASSGGFSDFSQDFSFTGTIVLAALDITDVRNPQLIGTQTLARASRGINRDAAIGGGLFAFTSLGAVGDNAQLLLVNATDPANLATSGTDVPTEIAHLTALDNLIYTASPSGLIIYRVGAPAGIPVTARVRVPNGTGVAIVPGSFNIPPTSIIRGTDFDTLVFDLTLGAGAATTTITWQSTVDGIRPGEARDVALDATIDFVSQGTAGRVTLPPEVVVGEQILALDPAARTARPGEPAVYRLTLSNPTATAVSYDLSVAGVPPEWVDLATSVPVPALGSAVVDLTLTAGSFAPLGAFGFVVTARAGGTSGSVEGTLNLVGSPVLPAADPEAHGVVPALVPAGATAGQGTPATFRVRITNTGSVPETFRLSANLPAGFTATFGQDTVDVPPGASNFREVPLTITPPPGTVPGAVAFTVTATSTTTVGLSADATGTLTVVGLGVGVALNPPAGAPGGLFQLIVTNTGQVQDTFDLALGGPAGLVTTLGTDSVTLAPGASQVIPIRVGAIDFALPGALNLVAVATSRTNTAVRDTASAPIQIGATQGFGVRFEPASMTLPGPGPASFLLLVNITGNVEDAYTVVITGTDGPVTANLVGLDGLPTGTIPRFRLPGLSTGAIQIQAVLSAFGQGTVTVQVRSLSDGAMTATATATVIAQQEAVATTTQLLVAPNPATAGQPVTFTALASAQGAGIPTGSIIFTLDGIALPPVPLQDLNGQAQANLTVPGLTVGPHSVVASYGGAAGFAPSISDNVTVTVGLPPALLATTTQLFAAPNPATLGQTVVFTAIVTASGGVVPGGTVTFTIDGTPQPQAPLAEVDGRAQAMLTIAAPGVGTHTVTASFDGGPGFVASVSDPVALVVVGLAPAPDGEGPIVTAVRRFGFHLQPTRLVVTFSEDVEAAGATDLANYLLVRRGRDGRFGTRDDRVIRLRGASYNPTTRAVTLRPSRRLRLRDTFLLTVRGLADRSGNRLDGDGDGRPGGDFVTVVDRRILAGPARDAFAADVPARAAGRRSTP